MMGKIFGVVGAAGSILAFVVIFYTYGDNPHELNKNVQEEIKSQVQDKVADKLQGEVVPRLVEDNCALGDKLCITSKTTQMNMEIGLSLAGVAGVVVLLKRAGLIQAL